MLFCDRVTSLRTIFSNSIHLSKKFMSSLSLKAEEYSIVYIYHSFYIHSSIEEHLASFQCMAIINRATMNILVHISLLSAGETYGFMPRSGIMASSGSIMPSFLRNPHTDFESGCMSLQPYQQWESVPLSPHTCQHLFSPEFLILAFLTG